VKVIYRAPDTIPKQPQGRANVGVRFEIDTLFRQSADARAAESACSSTPGAPPPLVFMLYMAASASFIKSR
jgi:hypothetical protein